MRGKHVPSTQVIHFQASTVLLFPGSLCPDQHLVSALQNYIVRGFQRCTWLLITFVVSMARCFRSQTRCQSCVQSKSRPGNHYNSGMSLPGASVGPGLFDSCTKTSLTACFSQCQGVWKQTSGGLQAAWEMPCAALRFFFLINVLCYPGHETKGRLAREPRRRAKLIDTKQICSSTQCHVSSVQPAPSGAPGAGQRFGRRQAVAFPLYTN